MCFITKHVYFLNDPNPFMTALATKRTLTQPTNAGKEKWKTHVAMCRIQLKFL